MNLLRKKTYQLLILYLIIACNDYSNTIKTITDLDFTITTESGAGNEVSIKPSSSGAEAEYSVDFGDPTATDNKDVIATSGPKVTYTYPRKTENYTITVKATAKNAEDVQKSKNHKVNYNVPQTDIVGRWVLLHATAALAVGPQPGNFIWWENKLSDITDRGCLFDDIYEFKSDGSFTNILGDQTWLEEWQDVNEEQCGSPLPPHDGKISAAWVHDESTATIQILGKGAYLGLAKVYTDGELTSSEAAPDAITYNSVTFSEDKNTMTMQIQNGNTDDGNNGTWQFKFAKEGSEGASIPKTDFEVLPKIDFENPSGIEIESFGEGGSFKIIENPNLTGINTSNKVGKIIKGLETWAGSLITLEKAINMSTMKKFTMKIKPLATKNGSKVLFKLENKNDSGVSTERTATIYGTDWQILTFDFSNNSIIDKYQKIVLFFEYDTAGDGSEDWAFLIDDITQIK